MPSTAITNFELVNIRLYKNKSNDEILRSSVYKKSIIEERINILYPSKLLYPNVNFSYYFIGDAAFPLLRNLMRPYSGRNLSVAESNLNNKLSFAGVISENTFGILTARWIVLHNLLHMLPKKLRNK